MAEAADRTSEGITEAAESTSESVTDSAPAASPSAPVKPSEAGPVIMPSTSAENSTDGDKRLVLTASRDSFVSVTTLDAPGSRPLYSAVLHSGQSVAFDGHKFSINVSVPSAVAIRLDGVNYGPLGDRAAPKTFNVESHLP